LLAAFYFEQPAWLVALLAVSAAALALTRAGRPRDSGAGHATGVRRAVLRLSSAALAAAAALAVGAWLMRSGTTRATALLAALALLALVYLTLMAYRPAVQAVSPLSRAALISLRLLAGLLLLVLIARPAWDWVVVEFRRPLLVVLLDQSESMALAAADQLPAGQSRADLANAVFQRTRAALTKLSDTYDVRLYGFGATHTTTTEWHIRPEAPVTSLAAALRDAPLLRSADGAASAGVVLISDGADNVDGPRAVRNAAREMAQRAIPLWAVGVGPPPGQTPMVELTPLVLPRQLGIRDRLRVPVSARVQGCAGTFVTLQLLWGTEPTTEQRRRIDRDTQQLRHEYELVPPGPGVQRLTARVTLAETLGGQSFETFALVDVRDQGIRILHLEDAPRSEAAFIARALRSDPRLEVVADFFFNAPGHAPQPVAWSDYDVIILGRLRKPLPADTLQDLARAVTQHGTGLLLAGGRGLLNDVNHDGGPLATLSPAQLVLDQFGLDGPLPFQLTDSGARHPILQPSVPDHPAPTTQSAADTTDAWSNLPPLSGAAVLGATKPIASVLAVTSGDRPLLVAHEVGRGRCVAAAWETTWPWALYSEQGRELHHRLWRQTALWLANRRPHAWVLTDRPEYPLAALEQGRRRVRIRAGLSGLDLLSQPETLATADARLELIIDGTRHPVRLEQRGDEWLAELPAPGDELTNLPAGRYTLEFTVRGLQSDASSPSAETAPAPPRADHVLSAGTAFDVRAVQLETTPPTADLATLRSAAEETASAGGSYHDLAALPQLLDRLLATDRRTEIRRTMRYSTVSNEPWVLLVALTAVLALEWSIRKRLGLA
jgi:hypothetical protein